MIKFNSDFLIDEKANKIVKNYWNNRIINLIKNLMLEKSNKRNFEDVKENDIELIEGLEAYFPTNLEPYKRGKCAFELLELLSDDKEIKPRLMQQYFLSAVIEMKMEECKKLLISSREPIMEDRKYLLEILDNEFGEGVDTEEDFAVSAKQALEFYETLDNYFDFFFENIDFAMLDLMPEEDILNGGYTFGGFDA